MTKPLISPALIQAREEFENLVKTIRPELHRYAARMVGSVIDGEDVVQETLAKAYYSLATLEPDSNLRGWLFKIAHNKSLDFLRGRHRYAFEPIDESPPRVETELPLERKELSRLAWSVFLRLVPRQRSVVILKDVLGYSLAEISEILNATVPEIKATLHRARKRLRELAEVRAEEKKIDLGENKLALLARYVELFNARDFEGVRDLLADEVRLDLVGRVKLTGADEIRNKYFFNYDRKNDWHFVLGSVENRPAILVFNRLEKSAAPAYFLLVEIEGARVKDIRDYRYAAYVIDEASFSTGLTD